MSMLDKQTLCSQVPVIKFIKRTYEMFVVEQISGSIVSSPTLLYAPHNFDKQNFARD